MLTPCVAVCCSVLQCVAVCCSVLQCVAVNSKTHPHTSCPYSDKLQHTTTHWINLLLLQHTATHCNTLQHTATHCNTLPLPLLPIWFIHAKKRIRARCVWVCCSVFQYVAVCRSVLQCVAVRCSVLHCVALCVNMCKMCVSVFLNWLQYDAIHCNIL